MRAQLQAKCGSAPLRRTVTEPATRSTVTAAICEKSYKMHKELHLGAVVIGTFTYSSGRPVASQARTRQAWRRGSSGARAE
jgi:hypothetical protein